MTDTQNHQLRSIHQHHHHQRNQHHQAIYMIIWKSSLYLLNTICCGCYDCIHLMALVYTGFVFVPTEFSSFGKIFGEKLLPYFPKIKFSAIWYKKNCTKKFVKKKFNPSVEKQFKSSIHRPCDVYDCIIVFSK